ncbi:hypothetical protein GCM10009733_006860 [Nonomuraea maheshkhaliensis]|uniref:CSD domain-containing protein n=1 Tax=Nonomuraea maheshkhaliensis TaxID=419590 RepID=A0ABN2ES58_9ACTN
MFLPEVTGFGFLTCDDGSEQAGLRFLSYGGSSGRRPAEAVKVTQRLAAGQTRSVGNHTLEQLGRDRTSGRVRLAVGWRQAQMPYQIIQPMTGQLRADHPASRTVSQRGPRPRWSSAVADWW